MLLLDLTTILTVALLLFVGWPGQNRSGHWIIRIIALLLLSPGLRYFSTLFTFPIRLQLSSWAGSLLQLAGWDVQTQGNVLVHNGIEMAVDPACMGLQMTGVSLLVALFLLLWHESQLHKRVPVGWVIGYGLITFGLTITCNLFRIIFLVLFSAMPGTLAHEALGLLCVAVYTWLPSWGLAQSLVHRLGVPEKCVQQKQATIVQAKRLIIRAAWGIGLVGTGLVIRAYAAEVPNSAGNLCKSEIYTRYGIRYDANFTGKTLSNGFVQLMKPGVLIYLKPQPDWFSADHSPVTCWRGNGYELRQVRETILDGHPAYIGELRRKDKVLHTTWWFSNGRTTTISQLTMRRQILQGETGFILVNVTVSRNKN
jgi:exosortase N